MRPDLYNILLFLAAGGYNWQESFQHLPIPWDRPDSKSEEPTESPGEKSEPPPQKVHLNSWSFPSTLGPDNCTLQPAITFDLPTL